MKLGYRLPTYKNLSSKNGEFHFFFFFGFLFLRKVAIWGLSFQKNKNKMPLWTDCSHFLLAKLRHKNKHWLGLLSMVFFFSNFSSRSSGEDPQRELAIKWRLSWVGCSFYFCFFEKCCYKRRPMKCVGQDMANLIIFI